MPSEAILLRDFLLSRAPLTEVLSFEQFAELFPRSTRTHPQVALLYRELEHKRAVVLDEVAANIAGEAKRGEKLMRQLAASKARRRRDDVAKRGVDERDVDMEVQVRAFVYRHLTNLFYLGLCLVVVGEHHNNARVPVCGGLGRVRAHVCCRRFTKLYGPVSDFASAKPHTLKSVTQHMQDACADIEDEIAEMDAEAESLLADLKQTVHEMGQLRCRRAVADDDPKRQLVQEALARLEDLEQACDDQEGS